MCVCIYIYICVCVCVCETVDSSFNKKSMGIKTKDLDYILITNLTAAGSYRSKHNHV